MAAAAPQAWPTAPTVLWELLVWGGLFIIAAAVLWGIWPYRKRPLVWAFSRQKAWRVVASRQPAETFIILSAGIERSRMNDDHPSWEVFFIAFNGWIGTIRIASAGGSFKLNGRDFPNQAELVQACEADRGHLAHFTIRQRVHKSDIPPMQQGQNHLVLQLSDLRIQAVARDSLTDAEHKFIVPLPEHLQFNVRNHWNINPALFSQFYRKRIDGDD